MKRRVTQVITTATGVTLLAPGIALALPPEQASASAPDVVWTSVEASAQTVDANMVAVPSVQGEFSYSQTVITPNSRIAQVFQKATNALCQASREMTVAAPEDWTISVSGDVDNAYEATLGELAAQDEQTTVMGCACAGNPAGGAAIINAEVTGVPLASIIEQAHGHVGVRGRLPHVAAVRIRDGTQVPVGERNQRRGPGVVRWRHEPAVGRRSGREVLHAQRGGHRADG